MRVNAMPASQGHESMGSDFDTAYENEQDIKVQREKKNDRLEFPGIMLG
jgi:hypothetical protein